MKAILLALLVLGAVVAAAPVASATHRTCDLTDAPCLAVCLAESILFDHPCRVNALDPCDLVCVLP